MSYLFPLIKPALVALIASLTSVPLLRGLALRINFVDLPAPHKIHSRPLALLGGVGIFLSFALAVAFVSPAELPVQAIVASAGLLMILGLYDDRRGLHPALKLLGQAIAASLVISCGVKVHFLPSPYLSIPFTLLWIVGITNAFNLLDNMDGLSAGVAFISACTFATIAARYRELGPEQMQTVILASSLAGACLGFLPYNLYRASIFMGDAGSMVLGFILASVSILGSWHSPAITTSVLIPALILAYPIFDTFLVSILRLRRGVAFYRGGKDHSSHRLTYLGLSRLEAVLLIYLFSLTHAFTALLVSAVTFRLALLALLMSACTLFIFGMVLRKAPLPGRNGE